jgi:hypothetical protein
MSNKSQGFLDVELFYAVADYNAVAAIMATTQNYCDNNNGIILNHDCKKGEVLWCYLAFRHVPADGESPEVNDLATLVSILNDIMTKAQTLSTGEVKVKPQLRWTESFNVV